MHAFSDVHLHLMLFVDVFPCFPFHFDFVYQPYIGYMLRYTSCIYMYKRAGTSDILTFVYTTGLVVFWIDLCRNCVSEPAAPWATCFFTVPCCRPREQVGFNHPSAEVCWRQLVQNARYNTLYRRLGCKKCCALWFEGVGLTCLACSSLTEQLFLAPRPPTLQWIQSSICWSLLAPARAKRTIQYSLQKTWLQKVLRLVIWRSWINMVIVS